jgi:hypothetical protein
MLLADKFKVFINQYAQSIVLFNPVEF